MLPKMSSGDLIHPSSFIYHLHSTDSRAHRLALPSQTPLPESRSEWELVQTTSPLATLRASQAQGIQTLSKGKISTLPSTAPINRFLSWHSHWSTKQFLLLSHIQQKLTNYTWKCSLPFFMYLDRHRSYQFSLLNIF